MTRTQAVLGWIYLPVHIVVLPLLLNILNSVMAQPMTSGELNAVYYLFSTVVILAVTLRYLRSSFDVLLDNRRGCFMTVVMMVLSNYAMSLFMSLLLMLLGLVQENATTEMVALSQGRDYAMLKAVAVFLAPIAEEVLFRGLVFGNLKDKSRTVAYLLSCGLFALLHVWQFAVEQQDITYFLMMVQYLVPGLVLAWAYDHSGSLWTSIGLHAAVNALATWAAWR